MHRQLMQTLIFVTALVTALTAPNAQIPSPPFAERGAMRLTPPPLLGFKPYSKHHALVIGIDNYENPSWDTLTNAVKDAEEVAAELERRNFKVTKILDKEATYQKLQDAFRDFVDDAQDENARAFIWFAGHGHSIGDREYILPVDALAADAKRFSRRAIRLSVLKTLFEDMRSRHLLAVFDSCFSGSIHEKTQRGVTPPRSIQVAANNRARQILSSGSKGQKVSDDGKFRELFLAAIRGERPDADGGRDGYVTGGELANFLKRTVASHRRGLQVPVFTELPTGDQGGSFVFKTALPTKPVEPEPARTPTGRNKFSALGKLLNRSENASGSRRIKLYHLHTKENLDVVYKRAGAYIPDALEKINWFLRDWRNDESSKIDPALIDLLWETHHDLGSEKPAHIISAFRSPNTMRMLSKRRGGQARRSLHTLGKAVDVHFPDVPLKLVNWVAKIRRLGGVGQYPTSGIPFIHLDTGRVRYWPRRPQTGSVPTPVVKPKKN